MVNIMTVKRLVHIRKQGWNYTVDKTSLDNSMCETRGPDNLSNIRKNGYMDFTIHVYNDPMHKGWRSEFYYCPLCVEAIVRQNYDG